MHARPGSALLWAPVCPVLHGLVWDPAPILSPAPSLHFGGDDAGWEAGWGCTAVPTLFLSPCQVLVPTRVGQVYVYDSPKGEQDEYDIPRHLLPVGSQEIYDVPPVRGGVPSQFSQEVRLGRGLSLAPSPGTGNALAQPGIQIWANYTQSWAYYRSQGCFWCLHPFQSVPGGSWAPVLPCPPFPGL